MNAVGGLQQLGFSEYEAKVYVALLGQPGSTGYELARRSGVPRSKIYEVLENLLVKDAAHTSQEGERLLYHPMPHKTLLQRHAERTKELVQELMPKLDAEADRQPDGPLITIRGYESLVGRGREMIGEAERNVFVSAWPRELEQLRAPLVKAEDRGVRVFVLVYGDMELPLRNSFRHEPPSPEGRLNGTLPALIVVADHEQALLAGVGPGEDANGLWTRNRGMTLIAAEFVKHDIFLAQLVERAGPATARMMANMQDLQKMWFE